MARTSTIEKIAHTAGDAGHMMTDAMMSLLGRFNFEPAHVFGSVHNLRRSPQLIDVWLEIVGQSFPLEVRAEYHKQGELLPNPTEYDLQRFFNLIERDSGVTCIRHRLATGDEIHGAIDDSTVYGATILHPRDGLNNYTLDLYVRDVHRH